MFSSDASSLSGNDLGVFEDEYISVVLMIYLDCIFPFGSRNLFVATYGFKNGPKKCVPIGESFLHRTEGGQFKDRLALDC